MKRLCGEMICRNEEAVRAGIRYIFQHDLWVGRKLFLPLPGAGGVYFHDPRIVDEKPVPIGIPRLLYERQHGRAFNRSGKREVLAKNGETLE
jgi:hypothetical protein